ncbi:uncharacterized protein LOC115449440 isoform X2 [Manduca sexta]|uniref:Uncharacterized protein n=1 Tax=Manduca sexta TaxID=7130 RepID=A0A922CU06_MANSE|nr:uncharacterized protein LOC115449440 isoform X2 [Manduca sexta]KAG6459410.1 hypothetical protein O3G_MSEX011360 [Manduca sexta]
MVEAAPNHPKQLGSWFGSFEQVDFRDMQVTPTTTDNFEIKPPTHKKMRKRKANKKKKAKETETDKQELKKKKKHKKKDGRRFVKTMVRERDGEYNASSSIENGDRRKPVDIIVHIKMHD